MAQIVASPALALDAISGLVRRGRCVRVVYTTGQWLDVASLDDVLAAGSFA